MDHEKHMRLAIEVAKNNPDSPFGAVIVDSDSGEVLATSFNGAERNPMWHAEIGAIIRCSETHPRVDWSRLTLYTTAEPCPMCSTAVLWSGIPRLIYGTSVEALNELGLPRIDLRIEEISHRTSLNAPEVTGGVLRAECDSLFDAMIQRTQRENAD